MKGNMKKVITLVMALVLVLSISIVAVSALTFNPTVVKNSKGELVCTKDGKAYNMTGFASNDDGMWYVENGKVTQKTTDVIKTSNGDWYNVVNSKVTAGPTVAKNANGWWYINELGKVDFKYTGLAKNANGTWYVENGKVRFNKTGAYKYPATEDGTWYAITKSKVDATFSGFANAINYDTTKTIYFVSGKQSVATTGVFKNKTDGKWYAVENGEVFTYDIGYYQEDGCPLFTNSNGTWAIAPDGTVDFKYNGIGFKYVNNTKTLYVVKNGKINTSANGVIKTSYKLAAGTTYVWVNADNGRITRGHYKLEKNSNGWWYINHNGFVDFSFTGLAKNANGIWFVENGKVRFNKTGAYKEDGDWYALIKSKVDSTYSGKLTDINNKNTVIKFVDGIPENADGLYKDTDGKWKYFEDGNVTKNGPFLAQNINGIFYVNKDGIVDFKFTGLYVVTEEDFAELGSATLNEIGVYAKGFIIYLERSNFKGNKTAIMTVDPTKLLPAEMISEYAEEAKQMNINVDLALLSNASGNLNIKTFVKDSVVYVPSDIGGNGIVTVDGESWLIGWDDIGYVYGNIVIPDIAASYMNVSYIPFTGAFYTEGVYDNILSNTFDDETYYYFKNGKFDASVNGFVTFDYSDIIATILAMDITRGQDKIDTEEEAYDAFYDAYDYIIEEGTYLFKNGVLVDETGLYNDGTNLWYLVNGKVQTAEDAFVADNLKIIGDSKTPANAYVITKDGKVDTSFTGLAKYADNFYYFTNGVYDTKFEGLVDYTTPANGTNPAVTGTYYVKGGVIDVTATGLYYDGKDAWYVNGGVVDKEFAGEVETQAINAVNFVEKDEAAKAFPLNYYLIKDGKVDTSFTGLVGVDSYVYDADYYRLAYYTNGAFDTEFEGLVDYVWEDAVKAYDDNDKLVDVDVKATYYVKNGSPADEVTGLYYDGTYAWFVNAGKVEYNEVAVIKTLSVINANESINAKADKLFPENGVYYILGGKVDTTFTGLYNDNKLEYPTDYAELAYFTNGILDADFEGLVDYVWEDAKQEYDDNDKLVDVDVKATYYVLNAHPSKETTGLYYDGTYAWYVNAGIVDHNEKAFTEYATIINANPNAKAKAEKIFPANTYYILDGKVDTSFTGLAIDKDGNYYYYANGAFNTEFEGLVEYTIPADETNPAVTGTYYVKGGVIDVTATGLYYDGKDAWYVVGGVVDKTYAGGTAEAYGAINAVNFVEKDEAIKAFPANYYVIKDGKVDTDFTGFVPNNSYFIKGAYSGDAYIGITTCKPQGKDVPTADYYLVYGGEWTNNIDGLYKDKETGLVAYFDDSVFNKNASGVFEANDGKFYVISKGLVNEDFTGVVAGCKAYFVNGVQTKATKTVLANYFDVNGTLIQNNYWYIPQDSNVTNTYSGTATIGDKSYTIYEGHVTAV